MTENEARYIVRMIDAFKENVLFTDATDEDSKLLDEMKKKYFEGGRWQAGSELARVWLIMHVSAHGVPGGVYYDKEHMTRYLGQREIPLIVRPSAGKP